jgi:hypothetical protein
MSTPTTIGELRRAMLNEMLALASKNVSVADSATRMKPLLAAAKAFRRDARRLIALEQINSEIAKLDPYGDASLLQASFRSSVGDVVAAGFAPTELFTNAVDKHKRVTQVTA